MQNTNKSGVFQLDNGYWGFRYVIIENGKKKDIRRKKDEFGQPMKTEKDALKAREVALRKSLETSIKSLTSHV